MAREKNWQFVWNHSYTPSSVLDLTRYSLWFLAATITGNFGGMTGSGLWTLYASSDGVTAGTDSTDRWQLAGPYDGTKLIRAAGTSAHSWIVLKSPYVNGSYWYLCLSLNTTADSYAKMMVSKSAPTGGSITASPTSATTGWSVYNGGTFAVTGYEFSITAFSSYAPARFCISLAEDGQITINSFIVGSTLPLWVFIFAPLADYNPSDLYPIYVWTSSDPLSAFLLAYGNYYYRSPFAIGTGCTRYIDGTSTRNIGNIFLEYTFMSGKQIFSNIQPYVFKLPSYVFIYQYSGANDGYVQWRGRLVDIFSNGFSVTQRSNYPSWNTVIPAIGDTEYVTVGHLTIPAPSAIIYT